ncbi:MAG: flagellar biosynthesis protein FlhF [Thermodesulfovibrionales bacterium]|nr:flagellar biosynthesis protein FlhF [Thermodesulfovibrionales bacterium]
MKIKKFTAKNYKEALQLVKKEFGEDAVILASEEKKDSGSLQVEITAAIDYDSEILRMSNNKDSKKIFKSPLDKSIFSDQLLKNDEKRTSNTISFINLRDSINSHINLEKKDLNRHTKSENRNELFEHLRRCSIREDYAATLCRSAGSLDDIIFLMKHKFMVRDISQFGKVIMLIGPTGVGKTTTVAKLAAKAIKEGKKVGIINIDTYRIGACEQIRIYTRIMGIPLINASDEVGIKDGISKFLKNRDIIFIDTMGRNPKDEEYTNFLLNLSILDKNIEIHLLISANSDEKFIQEIYQFYKKLPISCVAFTKVDEAFRFGSLYNLLMTYRKPVAYLTTGQRVPDDIKFPSNEGLSELIVGKGCIC